MDRRDRYKQTNSWIDGKDKKQNNRWIDGTDINKQIDGQTGKEQIDKQMERREKYRLSNRWIDGKEI